MFLTVNNDARGFLNDQRLSCVLESCWSQQKHRGSSSLSFACFSYCVYLRVKQASAACKLRLWSAHLVRERLICAECQSDAMSKSDRCGGDGMQSSRWSTGFASTVCAASVTRYSKWLIGTEQSKRLRSECGEYLMLGNLTCWLDI